MKRSFLIFTLLLTLTISFLVVDPVLAGTKLLTPQLAIDIPTVKFTDGIVSGDTLKINYLGDYIAGVYIYLIDISVLIAVIMLMIGGLRWVLQGGSILKDGKAQATGAQKQIKNAVTGLVLLLSTYMILFIVNPNLIKLQFPELEIQRNVELDERIAETTGACKDIKNSVETCTVNTITAAGTSFDPTLVDIINTVSSETGVSGVLIATHVQKETRGSITYGRKIGPCGEIGMSQFMPTTFEAIVGQECCSLVAAKTTESAIAKEKHCTNGAVEAWPPPSTEIPDCNTSICGNCQVAMTSCIDYFDTGMPDGKKNSITATAKLIKYNLSATGDIALAMCAYNGSGAQAKKYAEDASNIYDRFCTGSGGKMGITSNPGATVPSGPTPTQ